MLSNAQTFKKGERLCSKKTIKELFADGSSFFIHPFKVIWKIADLNSDYPAQILVSVSKRNFKKAVDRNKIKRQIRESFRKNKNSFYEFALINKKQYAIAFVFTAKEKIAYKDIESKIILILQRLEKYVDSDNNEKLVK
ncbi:MAG: ribonuclease P protein component [Saprospiraceae bacterium]|nr:ribonuclease P protein component [Saprospiraceae bacterium]